MKKVPVKKGDYEDDRITEIRMQQKSVDQKKIMYTESGFIMSSYIIDADTGVPLIYNDYTKKHITIDFVKLN